MVLKLNQKPREIKTAGSSQNEARLSKIVERIVNEAQK